MVRVELEYEQKGQMTLHRIAHNPGHLRDCSEWVNASPIREQHRGRTHFHELKIDRTGRAKMQMWTFALKTRPPQDHEQ